EGGYAAACRNERVGAAKSARFIVQKMTGGQIRMTLELRGPDRIRTTLTASGSTALLRLRRNAASGATSFEGSSVQQDACPKRNPPGPIRFRGKGRQAGAGVHNADCAAGARRVRGPQSRFRSRSPTLSAHPRVLLVQQE